MFWTGQLRPLPHATPRSALSLECRWHRWSGSQGVGDRPGIDGHVERLVTIPRLVPFAPETAVAQPRHPQFFGNELLDPFVGRPVWQIDMKPFTFGIEPAALNRRGLVRLRLNARRAGSPSSFVAHG